MNFFYYTKWFDLHFRKLAAEGYDEVKNWNAKVDLFHYDMILVPIHLPDHWTLGVIQVKNKTIKYYDSLKGRGNAVLLNLEQYMFKEHLARKKPLRGKYKRETATDNPTQSASSLDCGLFVSVYAEHISRNAPLAFDQIDMNYYRYLVAFAILKCKSM